MAKRGAVDVIIQVDNFDEIIKRLGSEVDAQARDTAEKIESQAKGRAPIDEGDLRDSISVERKDTAEYTVRVDEFYAWFVEYGTAGPYEVGGKYAGASHPGTPARPFLTPSAESERDGFVKGMKRVIYEL